MSESLVGNGRVAIEHLTVEITRRCQLKCAHCLNGDAQNVDMSAEIIDKLLDSVCSIGTLFFTGGEPTINLGGMRYFLDKIKSNNIALYKLQFITNGCEVSEDIINLIKEYYEYITYDKTYGVHKIIISISNDIYHKQSGATPEVAYEIYKEKFSDYPQIRLDLYNIGNAPKAIGRGENLKESIVDVNKIIPPKKIEIMNRKSHNYCVARKYYRLKDGVDMIIMCPIYISVYGEVSHMESSQEEFERRDNKGISILDNGLIDAISQYNQSAEECIACMIIRECIEKVLIDGEIAVKTMEVVNGDIPDYLEQVESVDIKKFNDIFNDQNVEVSTSQDTSEDSTSNENYISMIKEWRDDVGEDEVLRITQMANDILEKQLCKENGTYQRQVSAMLKLCRKIINDTLQEDEKETFVKEEERLVRKKHPLWSHKDCIRYANSEKWVKYYSGRSSNEDKMQLTRHQMILEGIEEKYQEDNAINKVFANLLFSAKK